MRNMCDDNICCIHNLYHHSKDTNNRPQRLQKYALLHGGWVLLFKHNLLAYFLLILFAFQCTSSSSSSSSSSSTVYTTTGWWCWADAAVLNGAILLPIWNPRTYNPDRTSTSRRGGGGGGVFLTRIRGGGRDMELRNSSNNDNHNNNNDNNNRNSIKSTKKAFLARFMNPKERVHQRWTVLKASKLPLSTPPSPSDNNNNNTTTTSSLQQTLPQRIKYNATTFDAGSVHMVDLYQLLQCNCTTGLSHDEATVRLQQFGPNTLPKPSKTSLWQLFQQQFTDRLVQILLVVAFVSAFFSVLEVVSATTTTSVSSTSNPMGESLFQSFVEPLVILTILFLNAGVGVWQSQSASDSMAALEQMQASVCTLIRDGQVLSNVPAANLVPGDIIELKMGDKVPADGRLITVTSSIFAVDEGSLTGESVPVFKLPGDEGLSIPGSDLADRSGVLFAGTIVTQGSGRCLVTHTSITTQFGRIQSGVLAAQQETIKTPLTLKLDEFGETLTVLIGAICLAVWVISIPKMNDPSFASMGEGALYYAKVAVALGVAAIPEGLPAVITLCLSLGTRRMAQRNVIVRNLPSVETLGCTSVICTDKTGTLTTNEMTAVSLVVMEHTEKGDSIVGEHPIDGYSYSPIGTVEGIPYNHEVKEQPLGAVADIAAVCALCNDARIIGYDGNTVDEKDSMKEEQVDINGNITLTMNSVNNTKSKQNRSREKRKKNDGVNEKTYERVGEPTEAALCVLAEKLGGLSHYLEGQHNDRKGLHFNVPPSVLASANVDSWRELHSRLATLEFSRDRKSMSVLCDFPNGSYPMDGGFHGGGKPRKAGNRLLVKGAPNMLIERCTHVKFRDGTVCKMTGKLRREIEVKVSELAIRPLRCLALAVKDSSDLEESLRKFTPNNDRDVAKHPLLSDAANYLSIESGLTLIGIVGIKDPARPGVAASIQECSRAGIRVIMITGDAIDTGVAIARDVNIFPTESECQSDKLKAFQGREFFVKPLHEQMEILKTGNIVFCRAEPADKQKLVKMLQNLNEIVAMTGDGVNDAPALQQADIGIAMGITGTEVSKEASDMILADDDFSTIVNAVEEGRRIYNNMQAFICFLISCNIGEICAIFFATLAGFPEPLTAMHLLWVNLVTDGPPATALGFNPPAPNLMDAPPRPSDEPIMTRWLLTRYCLTGLYVGLATIGVFAQHYLQQGISLAQLTSWSQCGEFWTPGEGVVSCSELFVGSGRMLPQTLALTTLVCMEMLKALSAVSVDNSIFVVGPQDNKWLLLGVSGPILLHLFVLYSSRFGLGGLGESFGMVPLTLDNWITVLSWAFPILLVDELLKAIGRLIYREERKEQASRRASKPTMPQ